MSGLVTALQYLSYAIWFYVFSLVFRFVVDAFKDGNRIKGLLSIGAFAAISLFVAYQTGLIGPSFRFSGTAALRECGEMSSDDYKKSCLGKRVRFTGIVTGRPTPSSPNEVWVKLGKDEGRGFDVFLTQAPKDIIVGMIIDFEGEIGKQNTFRPDIVDASIVSVAKSRSQVEAESGKERALERAAEIKKLLTAENLEKIKKWKVTEDQFYQAAKAISNLGWACQGASKRKSEPAGRMKSFDEAKHQTWSMMPDGRILIGRTNLEIMDASKSYRDASYICVFDGASAESPSMVQIN